MVFLAKGKKELLWAAGADLITLSASFSPLSLTLFEKKREAICVSECSKCASKKGRKTRAESAVVFGPILFRVCVRACQPGRSYLRTKSGEKPRPRCALECLLYYRLEILSAYHLLVIFYHVNNIE